ncbi:MAG: sulfatase-like hydrolase/transferase [Candidatus Aminicenantes bacterium]|nr:sulfatase-like hydrolase/transferase [Candidatus Aminicenantes bacterium]
MKTRAKRAAVAAVALVLALGPGAAQGGGARPNVLLVTVDTLRADRLGCYGATAVRTPVVDALARRGVLFEQAFAQTPTTLPSHATILLGVGPLVHGVHDNANFVVSPECPTLAGHLKSAGYATAAVVGAYPLDSRFGLTSGFDLYDDDYGRQKFEQATYVERPAGDVVAVALDWLWGRAAPWFLWVHLFDPHAPYAPPEPFRSEYGDDPYGGEVAFADQALGTLFEALERSGQADRTLIVLTADHGESLGEHGEETHGFFAYNATLRVPLIVAAPGGPRGRRAGLVSHVDIFPTVCDLVGLKKPGFLQGASLVPLMKGKSPAARTLYFESLYPYYSRGWAPLTGTIQGREKFIASPIPELYDIVRDPGETENLAGATALAAYQRRLDEIVRLESRASAARAADAADRATREKLRSLGYISSGSAPRKTAFGPADDVKTLLPFHNRAVAAQTLLKNGDAAGAEKLLRDILAERDDIDIAYTSLAAVHKAGNRIEDALEVLRLGTEKLPDNYEIFLTRISALTAAGRYADVIGAFESAALPRQDLDPEIWNQLGIAYVRTGNAAQAEAAFEKALALDPDHPAALSNKGTLFLSRALATGESELLEKAAACFAQAAAVDPSYAPAYNGMGAALRRKGDISGAVAAWEKALALDPASGNALYNLGVAYLEQGRNAEARELLLRYQSRFASSLPPDERARLEALIRRASEK